MIQGINKMTMELERVDASRTRTAEAWTNPSPWSIVARKYIDLPFMTDFVFHIRFWKRKFSEK